MRWLLTLAAAMTIACGDDPASTVVVSGDALYSGDYEVRGYGITYLPAFPAPRFRFELRPTAGQQEATELRVVVALDERPGGELVAEARTYDLTASDPGTFVWLSHESGDLRRVETGTLELLERVDIVVDTEQAGGGLSVISRTRVVLQVAAGDEELSITGTVDVDHRADLDRVIVEQP